MHFECVLATCYYLLIPFKNTSTAKVDTSSFERCALDKFKYCVDDSTTQDVSSGNLCCSFMAIHVKPVKMFQFLIKVMNDPHNTASPKPKPLKRKG